MTKSSKFGPPTFPAIWYSYQLLYASSRENKLGLCHQRVTMVTPPLAQLNVIRMPTVPTVFNMLESLLNKLPQLCTHVNTHTHTSSPNFLAFIGGLTSVEPWAVERSSSKCASSGIWSECKYRNWSSDGCALGNPLLVLAVGGTPSSGAAVMMT